MSVTETIRAAVLADPRRISQLSRDVNMAEGSLHLFMKGKIGLRSPVVDRLAEVLGLTMVSA